MLVPTEVEKMVEVVRATGLVVELGATAAAGMLELELV